MAEIFDFRSKKKIDAQTALAPKVEDYKSRIIDCIAREQQTMKPCDCRTCVDKRVLATRLVTISNWLCLDYMEKNKDQQLFWGDWLDIMFDAYTKVMEVTTNPKK